jgi:hypothetical protein
MRGKRAYVALLIIGLLVITITVVGSYVYFHKEKINQSDKKPLSSDIFCQRIVPWKLCYLEVMHATSFSGNQQNIIRMYRCYKEESDKYYYYEKNEDYGAQTWTFGILINSSTEKIDTYTIQGDSTCSHNTHFRDADYHKDVYYKSEFSSETKTVDGLIGLKLIQENSPKENISITNTLDYINQKFCYPLTQVTKSPYSEMNSERTELTNTFDDSIFNLPESCKNAN